MLCSLYSADYIEFSHTTGINTHAFGRSFDLVKVHGILSRTFDVD